MSSQKQTPKYVFDNAGEQTPTRFSALETLFDVGTFRHFDALGISPGWRCLEIGGGSGSVASWLSHRVGPEGRVVVTDINTRFLAGMDQPNVEVRQHDVVNDDLERDYYNVAHTRLVLIHLPERGQAIARVISALKPGGWVLFEEFDMLSTKPDPAIAPAEVFMKTLGVLWEVMRSHGVDHRCGRLLPGMLVASGLSGVGAEGQLYLFKGASAGAAMLRANFVQMHDEMIATGHLTEEEFHADLATLDDPAAMWPHGVLWSVWGRRP
jgi:SAM-dependent methyltransferase